MQKRILGQKQHNTQSICVNQFRVRPYLLSKNVFDINSDSDIDEEMQDTPFNVNVNWCDSVAFEIAVCILVHLTDPYYTKFFV